MMLKRVMLGLYVCALLVSLGGIFVVGTFTGFVIFESGGIEIIDFFPRLTSSPMHKIDPELTRSFGTQTTHEVIVTLKEGKREARGFSRQKIRQEFSSGGFVSDLTPAEITQLSASDDVASIEPVRYFDIALQDAIPRINASYAWARQYNGINITGEGETICVVDTGINFTHTDLAPRNILGCNLYCVGSSCAVNCGQTDLNGHGTHVAGITGAAGVGILGAAPKSKLIGLKVFSGSSGTGASTTSIRNAIDWCVTNSATYNISVISISIASTTRFPTFCDSSFGSFKTSIGAAVAKNISVVAATGNNGDPNSIGAPACVTNATAVSATNKDDTLATSYANYAPIVSLVAPGTSINSTCLSGSYCVQTGTSMSTPLVSGGIALVNDFLHNSNRSRTPLQMKTILNNTGKKLVYNATRNYTRINVDAALLSLDTQAPTIIVLEPQNETQVQGGTIDFSCRAEDWQLTNATLFIYNASNATVYNVTTLVSGTSATVNFSVSNLSSKTYQWACSFTDAMNNKATSGRRTLFVGGLSTFLDAPTSGSTVQGFPLSMGCSVFTPQDVQATSAELFIWDVPNASLVYYDLLTGGNFSSTSYSFLVDDLADGAYEWNCLGHTSLSDSEFALSNYSLLVNKTPPSIALLAPANDSSMTLNTMPVTLSYSVTYNNPTTCSLSVNDVLINSSGFSSDSMRSFTYNAPVGDYFWIVSCSDAFGMSANSSLYQFSVDDNVVSGDPGSGSGGGSSGGGGGGGGGGGATSPGVTGGSVTTPSESSDAPAQSPSTPSENVTGGLGTGRVVTESQGRSFTWIVWIILALLVLFGVYRYLRYHYRSAPGMPQRRILFPLRSHHDVS